MAALLVTRFPDKGPELWAYQTTILKAAHNYECGNYYRQYRRDMFARKDPNWSTPNTRLYNEAFTGRAKIILHCPHCLSEDHVAASCPHSPNPLLMGWVPDPCSHTPQGHYSLAAPQGTSPHREVCHNFNDNRCRFAWCRFQHMCGEPHPAVFSPCRAGPTGAGQPSRGQPPSRFRVGQSHPYAPLQCQ